MAAPKTLIDKPELAEELITIAAEIIREMRNGCGAKERTTECHYLLQDIYRILPYVASPQAASMFTYPGQDNLPIGQFDGSDAGA